MFPRPPDTSNSHQPGNAKPLGRTLAGVLSGAAANLRSKLTHMNTAPELSTPAAAASAATTVPPSVQHHQLHHQGQPQQQQVRQQQQRRISSTSNGGGGGAAVMNGVEQSPAAIPVTVPGADLSKHAYSELHLTPDHILHFVPEFPSDNVHLEHQCGLSFCRLPQPTGGSAHRPQGSTGPLSAETGVPVATTWINSPRFLAAKSCLNQNVSSPSK